MTHKYIRIPFTHDTKQYVIDKLDARNFRYAIEEDYGYFSVDVGPDSDGCSEEEIKTHVSCNAVSYHVDRPIRDEHFKEPKTK